MIYKLYFAYKISPFSHSPASISCFFLMVLILLVYFRKMIQLIIKNTEKGALLTTQNLVEAETLCDRIAIMVSGRLRWVSFHSLHLTPKMRFPIKRDNHQMEFFFSAPSVTPFPFYSKFRNNVKNFRANIHSNMFSFLSIDALAPSNT